MDATAYTGDPWGAVRDSARYYSAIAKGYDELYGDEQERKYTVGLKMLRPSKRVLDVGCGTALFMKHVDGIYVGLDVSKGMLAEALKKRGNRAADFVLGDARSLPFRTKSFETCYSFTMLQNVPEPQEALGELTRVCLKAVVSSLRGKGLSARACEEVAPDLVCLIVDE